MNASLLHPPTHTLALIGLLVASAHAELISLKDAKDGTQTMNGLVSPLDQAGENFYLRNEDGLVEVRLVEGAKVGLLFRENGIKKMLENGRVVIKSTGQEFALPKEIYVKVRFKEWKGARRAIEDGRLKHGILHTTPLAEHVLRRLAE